MRASKIARRAQPATHSEVHDANERTMQTITRERHPFEGKILGIAERRRHNGEPHLLLKLPDSSRLRVPGCANQRLSLQASEGRNSFPFSLRRCDLILRR